MLRVDNKDFALFPVLLTWFIVFWPPPPLFFILNNLGNSQEMCVDKQATLAEDSHLLLNLLQEINGITAALAEELFHKGDRP